MRLADLRKIEPGTYLAAKVGYGAPKRVCFVGIGTKNGRIDPSYRLDPQGDRALVGAEVCYSRRTGVEWRREALVPSAIVGLWEPYAEARAKQAKADAAARARQAQHAAEADRAWSVRRARIEAVARAIGGEAGLSSASGGCITLTLEQAEALAARLGAQVSLVGAEKERVG